MPSASYPSCAARCTSARGDDPPRRKEKWVRAATSTNIGCSSRVCRSIDPPADDRVVLAQLDPCQRAIHTAWTTFGSPCNVIHIAWTTFGSYTARADPRRDDVAPPRPAPPPLGGLE